MTFFENIILKNVYRPRRPNKRKNLKKLFIKNYSMFYINDFYAKNVLY